MTCQEAELPLASASSFSTQLKKNARIEPAPVLRQQVTEEAVIDGHEEAIFNAFVINNQEIAFSNQEMLQQLQLDPRLGAEPETIIPDVSIVEPLWSPSPLEAVPVVETRNKTI